MDTSAQAIWESLITDIKHRVTATQYESWFSKIAPVTVSMDKIILKVPSDLYDEGIRSQYPLLVRESAARLFHREPEIELLLSIPTGQSGKVSESLFSQSYRSCSLIPHHTFENFIIGPSNRMAHAAALAVADAPGVAYNPLFLHAAVGLGKTHLMQAICHRIHHRKSDVNILYISCDDFISNFLAAVQNNQLEEFRGFHRGVEMLVIDDIHFFAGRERSQEEFFHTFNALYNAGKQIILSSDSPPKEIPALEERLVSRFRSGLVVELEPPSYETRLAILEKKARLRGAYLPPEVIELVARQVDTNIRELEGVVVKLIGLASLLGRKIDLDITKEVLREVIRPRDRNIRIEHIQKVVQTTYSVTLSDLQSKARSKPIAIPRQVAMYLARTLTKHSLEEIGSYFGGRDHTTVLHSIQKVTDLIESDADFRYTIDKLLKKLLAESSDNR